MSVLNFYRQQRWHSYCTKAENKSKMNRVIKQQKANNRKGQLSWKVSQRIFNWSHKEKYVLVENTVEISKSVEHIWLDQRCTLSCTVCSILLHCALYESLVYPLFWIPVILVFWGKHCGRSLQDHFLEKYIINYISPTAIVCHAWAAITAVVFQLKDISRSFVVK